MTDIESMVVSGRRPASPEEKPRPFRQRSSSMVGYLWLAPASILVFGVVYYSILYTGRVSLLDWDGVSPNPVSIGIENYRRLLHDPIFWTTIKNVFLFGVVTIVASILFGLLFAVLLHSQVRLKGLYKVAVFVPVVISPAATAPVFRRMLAEGGEAESVLHAVGLGSFYSPWLADPSYALWVLMGIAIWHSVGFSFVFYYASLTQVDESVIEAARIDGAGNWRILASITFPMMRGTTAALALLGCINVLRTFDVPFLVTGGGPVRATEFPGTYIYKETIINFHAGYGSALTMVLTAAALLLTVLQMRRARRASEAWA